MLRRSPQLLVASLLLMIAAFPEAQEASQEGASQQSGSQANGNQESSRTRVESEADVSSAEIALSPEPGLFAEAQELRISVEAQGEAEGLSIEYRFAAGKESVSSEDAENASGESRRFTPYDNALRLGALPGEERIYDLRVRALDGETVVASREARYRIDRQPPEPPKLTPASGIHRGELVIEIGSEQRSYFSINERDFQRAPDGSISVKPSQHRARAVRLAAYSVDSAGNVGRRSARHYLVLPERAETLKIRSPKPGAYRNRQLLLLDVPSGAEAYYSLDGPARDGRRYRGPTLLPAGADMRLRVLAEYADGTTERASVSYSAADKGLFSAEQGTRRREVELEPPEGRDVEFSLAGTDAESDRSGGSATDWRPFREALLLHPIAGQVTERVVRLRDGEERWRYVFRLDGRVPVAPTFVSTAEGLAIGADPNTEIEYRLDGGRWKQYTGPISSQALADASTVAARADYGEGRFGPTAEHRTASTASEGSPPSPSIAVERTGPLARLSVSSPEEVRLLVTDAGAQAPSAGDVANRGMPVGNETLRAGAPEAYTKRLRVSAVSVMGNERISEATGRTIVLDTIAPPTPEITVADAGVRISGSGRIFYRIVRRNAVGQRLDGDDTSAGGADDDEGTASDDEFRRYRSPVDVQPEGEEPRQYTFQAYAEDRYGNRSETAEHSFVVGPGRPALPRLTGIEDGGIYAQERVTVGLIPQEIGTRVYYTLTEDGSEPPRPSRESRVAENQLSFAGEPDTRTQVRVKLRARRGGRWGEMRTLRFTIDRRLPSGPTVLGVSDGAVYDGPRKISLEDRPSDSSGTLQVELEYRHSGATVDSRSFAYDGPFVVNVPDGTDRQVVLTTATIDQAGNRRPVRGETRFRIDRKAPPLPELCVVPAPADGGGGTEQSCASLGDETSGEAASLVFGSDVRVEARSPRQGAANAEGRHREQVSYSYSVTRDGSRPSAPAGSEKTSAKPLVLEGEAGSVVEYRIRVAARDDAGNVRRSRRAARVVVDRDPPSAPRQPLVRAPRGEEERGRIYWPPEYVGSLQYRFVRAGADGDTHEPGGAGEGSGEAGRHASARREPIRTLDSPAIRYPAPGADAQAPDTRAAEPGEELRIEFWRVDAAGNRSEVKETVLRPGRAVAAPVLRGVGDGEIYRNPVTVEPGEPESDTVIRFEAGTADSPVSGVSSSSPRLDEPISFGASDGQHVRYRIHAQKFSEGRAVSPVTRLRFRVDRKAPRPPQIVNAQSGSFFTAERRLRFGSQDATVLYRTHKGDESGAREASQFTEYRTPFRLSAESGTVLRYLVEAYARDAAGNESSVRQWEFFVDADAVYVAPETSADGSSADGSSGDAAAPEGAERGTRTNPFSSLQDALTFAQSEERRTVVVAGGTYELSSPLVIERAVSLRGGFDADSWKPGAATTTLRADEDFSQDAMIRVRAEEVRIEDMVFDAGGPEAALDQRGGSLTVREVKSTGALRVSDNGTLALEASEIRGVRGGASPAISATDSQLEITDSEIEVPVESASDAPSGRATAVGLLGAEGRIQGSTLSGNSETDIAVLLRVDSSRVTLSDSRLDLAGASGAVGIRAVGSTVRALGNRVSGGEAARFIHGVSLRNSGGSFVNNLFEGNDGEDASSVVTARLVGSDTQWIHNTIFLDAQRGNGYNIAGDSRTLSVNNLFASARTDIDGAAIYVDRRGGVTSVGSCYAGWNAVLTMPSDDSRWTNARRTELFRNAEQLRDAPGSFFANAVVQEAERQTGASDAAELGCGEIAVSRDELSSEYGISVSGELWAEAPEGSAGRVPGALRAPESDAQD